MRIKILSIAENDLEEGYRFYEAQAETVSALIFLIRSTLTLTRWPISRECTA